MKHDPAAFGPSAYSANAAYGGQRAVEDRVKRFLPLVRKAAWHIYGSGRDGLEVEDLMQAGLVALTDCARRHNGPGEDGFAAYAKMRVRGAMFDLLRKLAPCSRGTMRKLAEADKARTAFQAVHGRLPNDSELAGAMGIDQADVLAMQQDNVQLTSLDNEYDDHSTAFSQSGPDPFEQLAEAQNSEALAGLIAQLPERMQTVLQLYFVEELNLTEIAAVLDVSVPRIHQIKAAALGKLRELLEA